MVEIEKHLIRRSGTDIANAVTQNSVFTAAEDLTLIRLVGYMGILQKDNASAIKDVHIAIRLNPAGVSVGDIDHPSSSETGAAAYYTLLDFMASGWTHNVPSAANRLSQAMEQIPGRWTAGPIPRKSAHHRSSYLRIPSLLITARYRSTSLDFR